MPAITLTDLTFTAEPLLDGVTLTVADGERACLVGPNGCGKTTLLRLVAGDLTPDSGTVTAIIYVTTTKHYQGDDKPSSETIPHKVILLPTKDTRDGYVVMADDPLDQVKEHLPDLVLPND